MKMCAEIVLLLGEHQTRHQGNNNLKDYGSCRTSPHAHLYERSPEAQLSLATALPSQG